MNKLIKAYIDMLVEKYDIAEYAYTIEYEAYLGEWHVIVDEGGYTIIASTIIASTIIASIYDKSLKKAIKHCYKRAIEHRDNRNN